MRLRTWDLSLQDLLGVSACVAPSYWRSTSCLGGTSVIASKKTFSKINILICFLNIETSRDEGVKCAIFEFIKFTKFINSLLILADGKVRGELKY